MFVDFECGILGNVVGDSGITGGVKEGMERLEKDVKIHSGGGTFA